MAGDGYLTKTGGLIGGLNLTGLNVAPPHNISEFDKVQLQRRKKKTLKRAEAELYRTLNFFGHSTSTRTFAR